MHCVGPCEGPGVALAEAAEAEAEAVEVETAEAAEAAQAVREVAEAAEAVREVRLASPSFEAGLPCPALPSAIPAPRPVRQAAQTSASLASDMDRTSRATTASATTSAGHSRASSAGSAAAITGSAAAISGAAIGLQPPAIADHAIGLQGRLQATPQTSPPLAAFTVAGGKSAAKQLHGTRAPADAAGAKLGPKAAQRGQQGAQGRERGERASRWRLVHRAVMRAPRNR